MTANILHDLSIDAYHQLSRVSSSKLSTFLSKGPAAYHARYIAKTVAAEENQAFVVGQATEDALFCPDVFAARYAVRPEGLDMRTTAGKAWKAQNESKPCLSAQEAEDIREMVASVRENTVASAMLAEGTAQLTAFMDWPGLPGLQSRPDWCDLEGAAVTDWRPYCLDLKTTSDFNGFQRSATNFGYFRQAAISKLVLEACGITGLRHFLLVVEKAWPYRCQVMEFSPRFLSLGEDEVRRGLADLARCYAEDSWPRCEEISTLEAPGWLLRGSAL